MLCWLPSCDQKESIPPAPGEAGAGAVVLPCFPDDGPGVLEIRGVPVPAAAIHRMARLKQARNPSLSVAYATSLAVEEALLPQAMTYALYRDRLPDMMRRLDVIREQLAIGASFEEVARESSEDPTSGPNGGLLGEMARKSPFNQEGMIESVEDVAFALAVGERSPPFLSPLGIHILEVRGETPNPLRPELTKREVAHILVAFESEGLEDGSFVRRLRREKDTTRIRVLDPEFERYVPAVLRER